MTALAIIDMQADFLAARHQKLIDPIISQIKIAKKQKAPVLLVEWRGLRGTRRFIKNELKGYRNTSVLTKEDNDGSWLIHRSLKQMKYEGNVRVCGVNTDLCVHDTVAGLDWFGYYGIEVVSQACWTDSLDTDYQNLQRHAKALVQMERLKLVSVI